MSSEEQTAPESESNSAPAQGWPQDLMLGLLPFLITFNLLVTFFYLPMAVRGLADFRQLYTGGYMIKVGAGHDLYDYDIQRSWEQRLVPVPTHLPVNHLAYEHLLLVLLSVLPYRSAYWTFFVFNIALSVLALKLLDPRTTCLARRWKLFPACVVAAFFPVWRALLQGQDSLILLALLSGAFFLLEERPFNAGLLVGLGLFKFQIVLPIALLLLLWRQWRFCGGFGVSGLAAIAVSVLMVGLHGVHQYVSMMTAMSVHLQSQADVVRFATSPVAMLNLRGLLTGIFAEDLPHVWTQAAILFASAGAVLLAARAKPSFPLAILAASLVSYHFLGHDASVLIIPILIALDSRSNLRAALAVAVILGTVVALVPSHGYLGAIPVLTLFVAELNALRSQPTVAGA